MNAAELQALSDKASPGPWAADDEYADVEFAEPSWCISVFDPVTGAYDCDIAWLPQGDTAQVDAEFIAALVNGYRACELAPCVPGSVFCASHSLPVDTCTNCHPTIAEMLSVLHPATLDDGLLICTTCVDSGSPSPWPCPTLVAVGVTS